MKKIEQMMRRYYEKCHAEGNAGLVHPEFLVVADRDECRAVSRDSIVDMDVFVDGEKLGATKVCTELDETVIARNMRWMERLYVGGNRHVRPADMELIVVDLENCRIHMASGQRTADGQRWCGLCLDWCSNSFHEPVACCGACGRGISMDEMDNGRVQGKLNQDGQSYPDGGKTWVEVYTCPDCGEDVPYDSGT